MTPRVLPEFLSVSGSRLLHPRGIMTAIASRAGRSRHSRAEPTALQGGLRDWPLAGIRRLAGADVTSSCCVSLIPVVMALSHPYGLEAELRESL